MLPREAVPWLSVSEMRAIDETMFSELGVELKQMMENAGRNLAVLARLLLDGAAGCRVTVLAGPGGNGGGGLVAARHLIVAGAAVRVRLGAPAERLSPATRDQLQIVASLQADVGVGADRQLAAADLVLDALLGYSQSGAPRGAVAELIVATAGARVLSLDVPSGLELGTGLLHEPHVRAEATMTLAAPKEGLRTPAAREAVGRLYLADISVPPSAFARIGIPYQTPFADGPLVALG